MVRKRLRGREAARVPKVIGLGLAVFLLTSSISVWAQQRTAPPAGQAEALSRSTSGPGGMSDAPKGTISEYSVSPEDLLEVYVMDVPEVTRAYRVSSNGLLTLPLLPEPIPAAGETLDQLSHLIAAKFREAGMLNNAHVTVSLVETRLHTVMVSGEVKNPQSYPIFGPTRLLDVLVKAGGLNEGAGNEAIIVRGDIGTRVNVEESATTNALNAPAQGQSFTVDIRKLVQTGDDPSNILLYPGDRVTVQRAPLIYILGAVQRPGGYVVNVASQQITVLKALANAGDVTSIAKKSRITVLRREPGAPPEKRQEIHVSYKEMVKGQIADMRLNPDDILFVPESGRIKAMRTSVNAAVQVATYGGSSLMLYR